MSKVKGIFKTAVSGILTAAMLLSAFLYSASAFDGTEAYASESKGKTKNQKNSTYNTIGNSDDFKSFVRKDGDITTTYYDICGGITEGRPDVSDLDSLMEYTIYKGKIDGTNLTPAEYWAAFATGVFASNHESYYSFNDKPFKTRFMNDVSKGGKGYGKLKEGLSAYEGSKASSKDKSKYRECDVNTIVSGKRTASNLNEVQDAAYSLLVDVNPGRISAKDFKNNSSLKAMEDDKEDGDIIYNLFATRDRQGSTYRYIYNCFGIAYSDFSITPVSAQSDPEEPKSTGVTTALKDYDNLDQALAAVSSGTEIAGFNAKSSDKGTVSSFKNESTEPVEQEISITKSKEETLSSTISHGHQRNFSSTQSVNFTFGKDTAFFKAETGLSFTEGELWESSVSDTNSTTNSESTTSTQRVTLPGHTGVVQSIFQTDYVDTMLYDCPVEISYTVTIFSYNGCYYDDNAKTTYFTSKGYSQSGFMTQFKNANQNLRDRKSRDVGYDESHGLTRGIKVKHGYGRSTYTWDNPWVKHLDYSQIKSAMNEIGVSPGYDDATGKLSDYRAISITGGELKRTGKGAQGSVGRILPLYTLNKVKLNNASDGEKDVAQGKTLNLSTIEMNGIDEMDGAFYGFRADKGEWQLVDDAGKTIKSSDVITLSQNSNGDYIVKGQKAGTANVKYFINEEAYTLYSEEAGKTEYVKRSDVKSSPIIQITVTEGSTSHDADRDAGADAAVDQPGSDISKDDENKAMSQISEADENDFVSALDCAPGQCSIAQAVLFVKNSLGADSDLNERIYTAALMQLASDKIDSNSTKVKYEADAIVWGMKNGLFDEMDRELLASQSGITELEFAEIAYKAAILYGRDTEYSDVSGEYSGFEGLDDFEQAAMNWAINHGILTDDEESSKSIQAERVL